jgi:glyoxylase-like metal-dependent hydrolase (beta-lactamase superfamily II)
MFVKRFTVGLLYINCYLVACSKIKEGLIIDPGFNERTEVERVIEAASENDLQIRYIVDTHGHPDHIAGNGMLKEATGAPILIHECDAPMLTDPDRNLSTMFGYHVVSPPADKNIREGDSIQVGEVQLKVLHTPGHSRGSISLLGEDAVFTGDTLFAGSIGRYDFPDSSHAEIFRSLRRLARLPDHFKVYPGHGPVSTIGEEKRRNPFLRNLLL